MGTLRLTPINVASAVLLAWIVWNSLEKMPSWLQLIGQIGMLAFLVVADQFFRLLLKRLSRIWIAELIFLGFTALTIWIIVWL